MFIHLGAYLLGQGIGPLARGLGQYDRKLLSSVPGRRVRRAKIFLENFGQDGEQLIASDMAMGVIVGLEGIDIQEEKRDRPAVTLGSIQLFG